MKKAQTRGGISFQEFWMGKRALYKFCAIFNREYRLGGFQCVNEVKGCLANRIASKRELLDEELCGKMIGSQKTADI
jgi:hypothetical protein